MSGFEGAPLSRLMFMSSACSLFVSPATKRLLSLDLGRVLAHGEVWRLGTYGIFFETYGEALNGALHVYWFRVLERMLGSRRFGAFAAVALSISTSLATGAVLALGDAREEGATYLRVATGPYALIFSMYSLYASLVPATRPRLAGVAGVNVSEKSLVYLAGAQLLFSGGVRTLLPGLCGLAAGTAYLSDVLKLYTWALPKALDRLWLFRPRRRPAASRDAPRDHLHRRHSDDEDEADDDEDNDADFGTQASTNRFGGGGDDDLDGLNAAMTAHAMAAAEPSPEHIDSLVAMGFDRDNAIQALRATGDNIEHAANRLLSG